MRHGVGNRDREIDDDLAVGCGLPDIDDGVADLDGIVGFCAGKAFGRIFKGKVTGRFSGVVIQELCTENGDVDNFFLGLFKDLFALGDRGGIV